MQVPLSTMIFRILQFRGIFLFSAPEMGGWCSGIRIIANRAQNWAFHVCPRLLWKFEQKIFTERHFRSSNRFTLFLKESGRISLTTLSRTVSLAHRFGNKLSGYFMPTPPLPAKISRNLGGVGGSLFLALLRRDDVRILRFANNYIKKHCIFIKIY